jgi:hypothetical protein
MAPCLAKAMAAARPMPVRPPVTKTTHPTIMNSLIDPRSRVDLVQPGCAAFEIMHGGFLGSGRPAVLKSG